MRSWSRLRVSPFFREGYCTVSVTAVECVSAPDVAVTIIVVVPAGVPVVGFDDDPYPPQPPIVSTATSTRHSAEAMAKLRTTPPRIVPRFRPFCAKPSPSSPNADIAPQRMESMPGITCAM